MFYKNLSRALVFGSPPQRLTFVWNRGLLSSVLFALFFVTSACDGSGTKGAAASANLECGEGRAVVDGHCIDDANSCETLGVFEQVTSYALSSETLNARVYVDEAAAVHACSVEQGPSGAVSFYYVQRSAEQFEKRAISASDTNALCMAVIGAPNGEAHVLSRSPAALFHTTDYGETWTKVELKGLSGSEIEGALSVPSARAFLGQTKQGVTVALSLSGTLSTPPSLYVARLGAEGLEVLVNGVTKSDPNATGHAPQVLETDEQGLMILFDRLQVPQVVLGDESLSPLAYTEGLLPRAAVGPDCEISVLYADRNSHLQLVSYDPFAFAPEEDLGVVGLASSDDRVPWDLRIDSHGQEHITYRDENQGEGVLLYRQLDVENPEILTSSLSPEDGDQVWGMKIDLCDRATVAAVEMAENGMRVVVWEGR